MAHLPHGTYAFVFQKNTFILLKDLVASSDQPIAKKSHPRQHLRVSHIPCCQQTLSLAACRKWTLPSMRSGYCQSFPSFAGGCCWELGREAANPCTENHSSVGLVLTMNSYIPVLNTKIFEQLWKIHLLGICMLCTSHSLTSVQSGDHLVIPLDDMVPSSILLCKSETWKTS